MLFTRLPEKKYLLGIDMGETGCQISYLNTRRLSADMDPHTFSRDRSGEAFEIPYAAADGWQEREGAADPGSSGTETDRETDGVRNGDMQTELDATENYLRYCLYCLRHEILPEEIEAEILQLAASVPGVSNPHDLRTRRIGNHYAIELHILVDGNITLRKAHDCASEVEERLHRQYGPDTHVAVHVEPTNL
jgi:hypothetical protein